MSKTFVYDRFDIGADSVSNVRPEMYEVQCRDGDWVKAEDAINREAVLQAEIRALQVQIKEAKAPQWISASERLPEERERPYQVIVVCAKEHEKDSMYGGKGVRRFQQDWVVRKWPTNFTHWMEAMPWPKEQA